MREESLYQLVGTGLFVCTAGMVFAAIALQKFLVKQPEVAHLQFHVTVALLILDVAGTHVLLGRRRHEHFATVWFLLASEVGLPFLGGSAAPC